MTDTDVDFTPVDPIRPGSSGAKMPRTPRAPRERDTTPAPPASAAEKLCEPLVDGYMYLGMTVSMLDPVVGELLVDRAEVLGRSWVSVAKHNPRFRKLLQKWTETSAWGPVFAAHAPIVTALAVRHVPSLRDRFTKMVDDESDSADLHAA